MGLVLRKDIGTKLSIADLDNNFEYLGMDSNDIDLHWSKNHIDIVDDELYIKGPTDMNTGKPIFFPKTFTSHVYQLGFSIRNYDLIKNNSPELIIERFKKPRKKTRNSIEHYSPARFTQTWPYNDIIRSNAMLDINPVKADFLRPMIIPVTASFSYYRIYAENYFSPVSPPRVAGCGLDFYSFSKNNTRDIYDDTNTYYLELPSHQKGSVTCRISIRINLGTENEPQYMYSKPLVKFKIKMVCNEGYDSVVINYDII